MNTTSDIKDLFKIWKTIIPKWSSSSRMEGKHLANVLIHIYFFRENDYISEKRIWFLLSGLADQEQLLVYWIYIFLWCSHDDEIFTKVKYGCRLYFVYPWAWCRTYLKNEHHFNLNDQIQICYQFSRACDIRILIWINFKNWCLKIIFSPLKSVKDMLNDKNLLYFLFFLQLHYLI